jgi:hypothetical protein
LDLDFGLWALGCLSPAEQELFDSEYELSKAGYTANEVNDALAFQKLTNEIIASPTSPSSNAKWDDATLKLTSFGSPKASNAVVVYEFLSRPRAETPRSPSEEK